MRYIKSGDYILGRNSDDVRDRINSISDYIVANAQQGEKIDIFKYVKIFEDSEGYTCGDVRMAVLGLIEKGVLCHDENDIIKK